MTKTIPVIVIIVFICVILGASVGYVFAVKDIFKKMDSCKQKYAGKDEINTVCQPTFIASWVGMAVYAIIIIAITVVCGWYGYANFLSDQP